MNLSFILASGSQIRAQMLRAAGIGFEIDVPRLDEQAIRESLQAEGAGPRDIADALAEAKARKVAARHPSVQVLGSDQVLAFGDDILSKPTSRDEAASQLRQLRNQQHRLLSAAVLYQDGKPVWRHVSIARLTMRDFSDAYLGDYLDRNWPDVASSVGGYKLESEGVRLFSRVDGDHFTILGLPLIELLTHLNRTGVIAA